MDLVFNFSIIIIVSIVLEIVTFISLIGTVDPAGPSTRDKNGYKK